MEELVAKNRMASDQSVATHIDGVKTTLDVPKDLRKGLQGLPANVKELIIKLDELGNQEELLQDFKRNTSPVIRKQLGEQIELLDKSYQNGGLIAYLRNAKRLLEDSRLGVNPLDEWIPSVPIGESFELGTKEYIDTEAIGLKEIGKVGFVLVAGGLGERLGYNNIKVGLPTELATGTCYLQHYIEYILAVQDKYATIVNPATGQKIVKQRLPLCIMTSSDTHQKTINLLRNNNSFGMSKNQITLVQQGHGVAALTNNMASMTFDPSNPHKILTKPHGHGDVHELLYRHDVVKQWKKDGIKWIVFFQDTNGLAFYTLPLMLGVSRKLDLTMNSLAVPRKAKQAIGGIAKLTNEITGETRTINVEYNQLDPMLRATVNLSGDVNDPNTGYSPYPGNINQLLFKLEPYLDALKRSKGLMPEFVNPKYKDSEKKVFKKPTRLECMMQDFPIVLQGTPDSEKVGFTQVDASLCFSPVKNATIDGLKLQEKGVHPGTAATGESDQYAIHRIILRNLGCHIRDSKQEPFCGIRITPGPMIVLKSDFVTCPGEYSIKFPNPDKIWITPTSTLIIRGKNVIVESLHLDGTLIIDAAEDSKTDNGSTTTNTHAATTTTTNGGTSATPAAAAAASPPAETPISATGGVISETDCLPYMDSQRQPYRVNMSVQNDGWIWKRVRNHTDPVIAMRGYMIERKQQEIVKPNDPWVNFCNIQ